MMRIRVYGKPGCAMCDTCKSHLDRMELAYEFVDVTPMLEKAAKGEFDGWRHTDMTDVMAAYQDYYSLPLVRFGSNKIVDYPEAMKVAKQLVRERKEAERARETRQVEVGMGQLAFA